MKTSYVKLLLSFLAALFLVNASTLSYAQELPANYFDKIVFFGDSLSDNGNLFWVDFGFLPKSPPYFDGHFSNGNVWSEYVTNYYTEKKSVETSNYAVGGMTAIFHNPIGGFLPYSLSLSLDNYLLHSIFRDRSHTLFVIWIGGNDYLPGVDNPEKLSTKVVDSIKETIESLIYHGGVNFLVFNLPDLSATPYAQVNDMEEMLSNASRLHNAKLAAAIDEIRNSYKDVNIRLFDVNQLLGGLLKNPDDFNQKYETHITNTTSSCFTGGYTLRTAQNMEAVIARNLEEQINKKSGLRAIAGTTLSQDRSLDTSAFAHYIATTPELLESYNVATGVENGKLCENPDEYVFWDRIHPTGTVHKMLSKVLIDYIDTNFPTL